MNSSFSIAAVVILGTGILGGTPRASADAAVPLARLLAVAPGQARNVDSTFIDSSVSPCADFYRYAFGTWLARTKITPDDTAADLVWGVTTARDRVGLFTEVAHRTRVTLLQVLDEARAQAAKTSDPVVRVVGNFYGSCINSPATDDAGKPLSERVHQWQCFSATDSMLGPALGELYTRKMLPSTKRAQAEAFVKSLQAAVQRRITQSPWINDSTRTYALQKLARYTAQIGAPPLKEDYSSLKLSATEYDNNRQAMKSFLYQEQLRAIGHATEGWQFRPWVINSTEHEATAVVEVSAVMWQPPLYEAGGDPAVNYGALGVLVSHEFMHAFGNVNRAWLDVGDQPAFSDRIQRLVDQANTFTYVDANGEQEHLDGKRTLEENLADLDGVRVAHDAFVHAMQARKIDVTKRDARGTTPEQRFFLSVANLFRAKRVTEAPAPGDFHSPERFRINGTLANVQAFAHAFGCKDGDSMVQPSARRVELW